MVIGGVEVSVDGGATWHPATGRQTWSYTWVPDALGPATIKSRAVDDSGNIESIGAGVGVVVVAPGADVTPPTVTAVSPAAGASHVSVTPIITAAFSEPMDPTTINSTTVELRDAANVLVAATVTYSNATNTATLDPTGLLAYSTTYAVTIRGGPAGARARDVAGNAMAGNHQWTFTTALPPQQGPGGPILVIASPANHFSRYYAEILRAEGLNAFDVKDLSVVGGAMLAGYDVVILGEMSLTPGQVAMFDGWVTAGGNLIAMRPDKQLAGLLGLTDARRDAVERVPEGGHRNSGPGPGIVGQTDPVPRHRDRYTLNGASSIATTLFERDDRHDQPRRHAGAASAPRAVRRRPSPTIWRAR